MRIDRLIPTGKFANKRDKNLTSNIQLPEFPARFRVWTKQISKIHFRHVARGPPWRIRVLTFYDNRWYACADFGHYPRNYGDGNAKISWEDRGPILSTHDVTKIYILFGHFKINFLRQYTFKRYKGYIRTWIFLDYITEGNNVFPYF